MRLAYLLLSPTFGMHQYTADLANRLVFATSQDSPQVSRQTEVHVITTTTLPRDRYAPGVNIHTPVTTHGTGLGPGGVRLKGLAEIKTKLAEVAPDVVHLTGPHIWNIFLMRWLAKQNIPTIHTIHDLDPHRGRRMGFLLHVWNGMVLRLADQILVHGQTYQDRLRQQRSPAGKISYTPLLHLFVSHEQIRQLSEMGKEGLPICYEPFILFFGRLERYKGIGNLLTAYAQMRGDLQSGAASAASQSGISNKGTRQQETIPDLVLAGSGHLPTYWAGSLPPGVEVRSGLIDDEAAMELFRRCSLVVLPYIDATQSALIAAAYFFHKPVVVTRTGALAEYVEDRETGYVVEPDHPPSLTRALLTMMADPCRLQEMGNAGRAWYDKRRRQETETLINLYEGWGTRGP